MGMGGSNYILASGLYEHGIRNNFNPLLHFLKHKLAPKTFGFWHQGDSPNPPADLLEFRSVGPPEGSPDA